MRKKGDTVTHTDRSGGRGDDNYLLHYCNNDYTTHMYERGRKR